MASFNLFANIDAFSSNDCSFGELDSTSQDIIELSEEVITPPVIKSKARKGRAKKAAKEEVLDYSDVCFADDDEVSVCPGVGQKTAFKKLSKIRKSLETAAVREPIRTRTKANLALREAYQQKRSRRGQVAEPAPVNPILLAHSSAILQPNIVNDSFDDEELSVHIKIKWEGTLKIEKVQFSMYKTFNELIEIISAREKIDSKSFLLMFGNNVIRSDDSPHSIGYTLGKFISVRVVENRNSYVAETTTSQCNTIEVKVQSLQWKKPMICNIKLTDQFKVLTGMCSEKLKCPPNKLRFKFDGEIIDNRSTPSDLDFEGGEILDLMMSD